MVCEFINTEIERLFEEFFQDSLFYLELNIFQKDEILTF